MNAKQNTPRGTFLWALFLAIAMGLATSAGMVLYAQYGQHLLVRGDNGVSRLFVGEAERMAAAGAAEEALALYDKAFRAGFSHPPDKNRALTLKGMLLWQQGRVRDAADALAAAVSGSAPNFDGAAVLVEALLHLRRLDEAQSVVRRWRETVGEHAAPQVRADMLCASGRVAQERGDPAGARSAFSESMALIPGNLAEYHMGMLCAAAGETAEARRHLDRYLLGGASGSEAAKAREKNLSPDGGAVLPSPVAEQKDMR